VIIVRRKPCDIKAELSDLSAELEALAISEEASLEELNEIKAKVEGLEAELDSAVKLEEVKAEILARRQEQVAVQPPVEEIVNEVEEVKPMADVRVIAAKTKHFDNGKDAYEAGMFLAAMGGSRKAQNIVNDLNIGTDADGGHLVPTPLQSSLINLLEEYGVARRHCRRIVMSADTWTVPKLSSHASISYPSEAGLISGGDPQFSQIQLVAKKIASLVKMSTEVTEDSVISIMDTVVQSIAYSIAVAEDTNLFKGVSGGILAAADSLEKDTNIVDVAVANVGALALTDLTAATVATGNPIIGARNEWFMNATLFHGVVRDLLNAAGGNSLSDLQGGVRPSLLGYPVNFVNVMDGASASGAGKAIAYFGDLNAAVYMGERRGLNFKVLSELYAENDQLGVQCTERVCFKTANPELLARVVINA
jgi:HK97 family phage major capsid protein